MTCIGHKSTHPGTAPRQNIIFSPQPLPEVKTRYKKLKALDTFCIHQHQTPSPSNLMMEVEVAMQILFVLLCLTAFISMASAQRCEPPSNGCTYGMFNYDKCLCECIKPFCPDANGDCVLPTDNCGGKMHNHYG